MWKVSVRYNFINGVSESPHTHTLSLSQNVQMVLNHHTSRLSISELNAAQLTGIVTCTIEAVASSLINCISSFLPVFKPFSTRALSWRRCSHTHSRTYNARFTHTRTHTQTLFALHMCICSSAALVSAACAELKWQCIVLYEPQDCL